MDQEAEYLRRRELRELRMARRARCPRARGVHRQLASIYASRRSAIDPVSPAPASWWGMIRGLLRGAWRGGRSPDRQSGALADEVVDPA
jgi:hypothetical protein